jgi:hypothetical protein
MAHSVQYQIRETVRGIELEIGRLLDLAQTLNDIGDKGLATAVEEEALEIFKAVLALRAAVRTH